jgi:hypothetical protein
MWRVEAGSFEWRVAAVLETSGEMQMVHPSAAWLALRHTVSELDCNQEMFKLKNQT